LLASALLARRALAEGGYFAGVGGSEAAGRAGAFTAKADDLTAVTFNPAGLAKLGTTVIQIGNQVSYNSFAFTRAPTLDYGNQQNGTAPLVTFNKVRNQKPWQPLLPSLGVGSNLGLENWGFALSAFAPSGVGAEQFPLNGGQRYMMLSRQEVLLTYAASAAWKHDDVFGIGATVEWLYMPRFNYSLVIDGSTLNGANNPVSSALDMQATIKGSAPFTFNAIVGAWYRPTPSVELGLSGQVVPTSLVAKSTLDIQVLNPFDANHTSNVMLTRNGDAANDVTVTLPLPLIARGGARYRHLEGGRERYDLELDVEYETWSRVKKFAIETRGLQGNYASQVVNIGHIDIQKNWRDSVAVKLGGDYVALPDRLTLRAGLVYVTAVADAAYANVDAQSAQMFGGAVGSSFFFGPWELVVAYQLRYQPTFTVSEANARVYQQVPGSPCVTDPSSCDANYHSPVVNAGTYSASSQFVSVDALYRFGL
jgi:long-subunit fatty acid transport protein